MALGHVGLVLGPEVSRLARSSADWCRLLDLCGVTDTLIGDGDGIYLPLPRSNPRRIRTDEETLALLPRLAAHYCDGVIAGIFNEQGRQTTTGERFTARGHQQRDHDDGLPRTRGDAPRRGSRIRLNCTS